MNGRTSHLESMSQESWVVQEQNADIADQMNIPI
jgi:hypothetical protein